MHPAPIVVNSQYISNRQDVETLANTGIHLGHLNADFECKCAVGLLGHFAGNFARHYICLGMPLVVDSYVFYSFKSTLLREHLDQLVLRGKCEYPIVLSAPLTSPWMYNVPPSCLLIFIITVRGMLRL